MLIGSIPVSILPFYTRQLGRIIRVPRKNMNKQDTSLEDIGQAIVELGTMISEKIDSTRDDLTAKIDSTRDDLTVKFDKGFKELGGKLEAIQNDIKDMYKMLSAVQKAVGKLRKSDKELDQRLTNLEEFAKNLSRQTGVPFKT